jgi:hypothetical protein
VKKILSTVSIGAVLGALTVTGVVLASTAATTLPPPIQGVKALPVILSSDTVTGGGTPTVAVTCAQTNYFKIGQIVVFRMWGNDVVNGGYALTPQNVLAPTTAKPASGANVIIPNPANANKPITLPMSYVQEPYTAPASKQISYWEAHWTVPAGYTLGVIPFKIVAKTLPTKFLPSFTGTYTQKGFAAASQLQVAK